MITQSYDIYAITNLTKSYKIAKNHEYGGHLGFRNIHQCHKLIY